jgi:ABC-2 type transport system permease protein
LAWATQLRIERFQRYPREAVHFARLPQVELQPRFWYNPELKSVNFQIPGVLALIQMALTLTPVCIVVVKERELGTLEQLSVTPIAPAELLIGKSIPIGLMGLVMTVVVTLIAITWFHVPLTGSVTFLLLCSLLFLLNTLGLGLLLSIVARTQLQAQLLASFITTPMIMLSGFLFPIANMPLWAQWVTYALPMRYYMVVLRGVFLKGQGFAALWPQAAAIAVLGVLLYLAGILAFRKRVD